MKPTDIFLAVFFSLAAVGVAFIGWADSTGRMRVECVDKGVVATIDRVNYRTAYFTLEDGRSFHRSQPSNLVPGAEICLKSEPVYDF